MVSKIIIIKLFVLFGIEIDLYCASAFDVYKDYHYPGGSGRIIGTTFGWLGSSSAAWPYGDPGVGIGLRC